MFVCEVSVRSLVLPALFLGAATFGVLLVTDVGRMTSDTSVVGVNLLATDSQPNQVSAHAQEDLAMSAGEKFNHWLVADFSRRNILQVGR